MSAVDSPTDSFAAFHPELSPARRWAILVCFVLAAAIAIMSQLTMTTCLPSITSEFAIDTAQGQWLTTSYMLTMGIMIPCTGFLMTRFQSRHLFLAANAVFFVGILGTFAQSFGALVAVRCVQGLAGGLFIPLMQVIAFRLFPPHQRGFAMGIAAFSSIARSWAVKTFCDTLPTDFFSSPNRFVPGIRSRRISTFHLSPMRVSVVSTGQAGSSAFAFASIISIPPKKIRKRQIAEKPDNGAIVSFR